MSLPALPTIASLDWDPPATTSPELISVLTKPLIIRADSDNSGYWAMVYDELGKGDNARIDAYWPGQSPEPHRLRLRRYWARVPDTYTRLPAGTSLKNSWAYTHGVSTTDSQSITVQIGASGEGLSASIAATFSHSVTVTDQTTRTQEYSVDSPAAGFTRVWLLWDLMYEFAVIHAGNEDPIKTGTYRGDVRFTDDKHWSGAYLNYAWTYKVISTGYMVAQSNDFHTASGAAA